MTARAQYEILLSRLQATHATLVAACTQVGAEILALKRVMEDSLDDEGDQVVKCVKCQRTNAVPCGSDGAGRTQYACECGANFFTEAQA